MSFSIKEVLEKSWNLTKKHFWMLVLVTFAFFFSQILLSRVVDNLTSNGSIFEFFATAVLWVASLWISMGLIRVALNAVEGKEFDVVTLVNERANVGNFILVGIIQLLVVVGGLILLIIPGVIWALMFSQAQYLVVDKGVSPIESMKESKRIMYGSKLKYLGFVIVVAFINLLGLIAFGIGLLFTVPMTTIASIYVYKKLNEQAYGLTEDVKNEVPVTINEQ